MQLEELTTELPKISRISFLRIIGLFCSVDRRLNLLRINKIAAKNDKKLASFLMTKTKNLTIHYN